NKPGQLNLKATASVNTSGGKPPNGTGRLLHPRLSLKPSTPGLFPLIQIDLTFIDITEFSRANKNLVEYVEDRKSDELAKDPPESDIHYGCKLYVLEHTAGKPRAWVVIVPEAANRRTSRHATAPPRTKFNLLVFFRPVFNGYEPSLQDASSCYFGDG